MIDFYLLQVDLFDMIDGYVFYLISLKYILNGINLDNFYFIQFYKFYMFIKDKEEVRLIMVGLVLDLQYNCRCFLV